MALTSYVRKKSNCVAFISIMHHNAVDISDKKPKTIIFYNSTKEGVCIVD